VGRIYANTEIAADRERRGAQIGNGENADLAPSGDQRR
jgi:hypothetical protein